MKTIFKFIIFSALAVSAAAVEAQTLSATPAEGKKFEDMPLTETVTLTDSDVSATLKSVSHGMRRKKVFGLVPVKVYVAEFFAADPTKLQKEDATILDSLKPSGPVQLRLTLARDLSGTQISDSFKEALGVNGVDVKNPPKEIGEILAELAQIKEFKEKEVFSLTGAWKDSNGTLYIQKPDGSIKKISGEATFLKQIFSIWFGEPADGKLGELKKTLLK